MFAPYDMSRVALYALFIVRHPIAKARGFYSPPTWGSLLDTSCPFVRCNLRKWLVGSACIIDWHRSSDAGMFFPVAHSFRTRTHFLK